MKKFIITLLCVCFVLSASGCKNESAIPDTTPPVTQPVQTQPSEATEATEETEATISVDFPLLAFSAPVRTQQHYANDGTLLFTYAYQDFSLILEDPQVADAIVIDLLNYVDYENSAAKSVLSDAEAAYDAQQDWNAFTYSSFFKPERFDQAILSLYGVHALYSGNPRTTTASVSVSYDLLNGRQLTLNDILTADYSADALSQLITDVLTPMSQQGLLFSDYAYVVSELFTTNLPIDNWYLSNNGLCFYFAPYEIAPYSSGIITAEIPYSALIGLLKDAYFPAEATQHVGSPFVKSFSDSNLERFEAFAELVIGANETQYLLYTDGSICNIRIELGSYSDDGTYLMDSTIFAAPILCSGNAIVIHAAEDILQNLNLVYEVRGEAVTVSLLSLMM